MFSNFLTEKRHLMVGASLMVLAMLLMATESRADSGFYVGGSVGQSAIELTDQSPTLPVTFDEEDFGWKGLVGYTFDLAVVDLGIEAAYVDLGAPSGTVQASQVEIDTTAITAFGVLGVDLGPVGVFGKYGLISWDAKGTVDNLPAFSDDGSDPAYGIGAKLGFASVDIRVEYELFDIDDAEDVSMISVGLIWTF